MHSWKAYEPIDSIKDGNIISFNEMHSWKAKSFIDIKEDGLSNVNLHKEVHPVKDAIPIEVKEEGICISLSDEQELNA